MDSTLPPLSSGPSLSRSTQAAEAPDGWDSNLMMVSLGWTLGFLPSLLRAHSWEVSLSQPLCTMRAEMPRVLGPCRLQKGRPRSLLLLPAHLESHLSRDLTCVN